MADSDEDSERRRSRDKFRRERSDAEIRRCPGDKREPFDDRAGASAIACEFGENNSSRYNRPERRGPNDYRPYASNRDRQAFIEPPNKRPRRDWNEDNRSSNRRQDQRFTTNEIEVNYRPPLMPFKRFLEPLDDFITDDDAVKKYKEYKVAVNKKYIDEFFEQHKNEEWLKEKYHPDYIDANRDQLAKNVRQRLDVFLDLFDKGLIDGQSVQMSNSENLGRLMDAVVIKLSGGTDDDLAVLQRSCHDLTDETVLSDHEERKCPVEKLQTGPKSEGEEDSDFDSDEADTRDARGRRTAGPKVDTNGQCLESPQKPEPAQSSPQGWTGVCISNSESEAEAVCSSEELGLKPEEARIDLKSDHASEPVASADCEALISEMQVGEAEAGAVGDDEDAEDDVPTPTTAEAPIGVSQTVASAAAILSPTFLADPPTAPSQLLIAAAPSREHQLTDPVPTENQHGSRSKSGPKNLHKTASIFFRSLPPTIARKELEDLCASQPGFIRLAIWEPVAERHFTRHAWATYRPEVNIKKTCWSVNNSQLLRDKWHSQGGRASGDLCATVNRELAMRVRPVSPLHHHKPVMRNDLLLATRLVAQLDTRHNLWPLPETASNRPSPEEVSLDFSVAPYGDPPRAVTTACPVPGLPGVLSANPLMRNLTDHLIDETGEEEQAYLTGNSSIGEDVTGGDDALDETGVQSENRRNSVRMESDESLCRALDRLLIYLRIVFSVDFYTATIYQLEDLMPHRCGIFHSRGDRTPNHEASNPSSTASLIQLSPHEISDYIQDFTAKISLLLESPSNIEDEEELKKLGFRDVEKAAEDFIEYNIQKRTSKKKPYKVVWVCPLSDKKFREPIFVRKHILNKHMDKIEAAKKDNAIFYNNYLRDRQRPALPEAPRHLICQYFPSQNSSAGDRNSLAFSGPPQRRIGAGGGYRIGGGGGASYRGGYRNSMAIPYATTGRNQNHSDFYDSSAQQQQAMAAAAAAAAAAALYPNTSATADLYALAGAFGGVRAGRPYNADYQRRRNHHNDRYRSNRVQRGVVSYNDLDDPGNEAY